MFRSTFGKTVLKVTAGSTAIYGAGVALSVQNAAFNELFTDNVPFAEEVVDFIQSFETTKKDYNVANFKEKFLGLDKTLSIPKSPITSSKIDAVPEHTKKEPAQKVQPVIKTVESKVKLPLIVLTVKDSQLQRVVDEFNSVITRINQGSLGDDERLTPISDIIKKLDSDLTSLHSNTQNQIGVAIKQKETELLALFSQKFEESLQNVELRHKAQLTEEIKISKEVLQKEYENLIKLNDIKAKDEFTKLIHTTIETERDGKLGQFTQLNNKLSKLTDLVLSLDHHLDNSELKVNIQYTLNKLKFKLNSSKVENLKPEIEELAKLGQTSQNDVLKASIQAINKDVISSGLLTQSQLIARFNLLTPDLRTAAILPPNAGVLGHLAAKFFSSLLFTKSGHVEGKDIESVISRVENYLITNNLDDAVEEIANLKGWSRKLADDWVVEGRKRLEVEFLVNLIDLESRTLY